MYNKELSQETGDIPKKRHYSSPSSVAKTITYSHIFTADNHISTSSLTKTARYNANFFTSFLIFTTRAIARVVFTLHIFGGANITIKKGDKVKLKDNFDEAETRHKVVKELKKLQGKEVEIKRVDVLIDGYVHTIESELIEKVTSNRLRI